MRRYRPRRIQPDINQLMKPLSEKVGTGNLWGSAIMNVQKDGVTPPSPSPTPTPSVTPTMTPTPSTPAWAPSSLTNLWDWWRADTGVSTDGSNKVTGWTGYSGYTFAPASYIGSSTNYPLYTGSSSDWNGEPAIIINPNNNAGDFALEIDATLNPNATGTDKTFIIVSKLLQKTGNGYDDLMGVSIFGGDNRRAIFGSTTGGTEYAFFSGDFVGGITEVPGNYTDGVYLVMRMSYNRATGITSWYVNNSGDLSTLTTTQSGLSGLDFNVWYHYIYGYNNRFGDSPQSSVVEAIWINDIPSATEISDLENYLITKYPVLAPPVPSPTPTSTLTPTPTGTPVSTPTPTPSSTPPPAFDADAAAYLADVLSAGGSLDATISAATDTLFTSLKSNSLYSKLDVLYLMLGETSGSTALNAIRTNSSFDITWNNVGSLTFGYSGVTGGGTGYGNTNYNPSVQLSPTDNSHGYYIVGGNIGANNGEVFPFGSYDGSKINLGKQNSNSNVLAIYGYNNTSLIQNAKTFSNWSGSYIATFDNTPTKSFYKDWSGGDTQVVSGATLSTAGLPNQPYYLFVLNLNGSPYSGQYYNGRIQSCFIGEYLTPSEVNTIDDLINTFETSLGRNVY